MWVVERKYGSWFLHCYKEPAEQHSLENVEAETMLAASLKMDGNKTVDTSAGGQLSGGHRGQWGNLWN